MKICLPNQKQPVWVFIFIKLYCILSTVGSVRIISVRTVLPPYFTRSSILIILHLKSSNQIAKFHYSLTKKAKFLSFLCQELERRQAEELHPRLVRRRREKRRTRTLLSRLTIRNSRGLRMRLVSSSSSGISRWDYLIESCDDVTWLFVVKSTQKYKPHGIRLWCFHTTL